jgi:hypothetical protein
MPFRTREALIEEMKQLRAAVHIYQEITRRATEQAEIA